MKGDSIFMDQLQFEPQAFVENLWVMGVGLVGSFLIIGIIMTATYVIARIPTKSENQ